MGNNKSSTADSISSSDSVNALKASETTNTATTDTTVIGFLKKAADYNMGDALLGKLALQNADNKRIKNLGAMMLRDQFKISKDLMKLASNKKVIIQSRADTSKFEETEKLKEMHGGNFDKAYVANVITDQEAEIKLFENVAQNSNDNDIKTFAVQTLRVLKNHLDAANIISASIK